MLLRLFQQFSLSYIRIYFVSSLCLDCFVICTLYFLFSQQKRKYNSYAASNQGCQHFSLSYISILCLPLEAYNTYASRLKHWKRNIYASSQYLETLLFPT